MANGEVQDVKNNPVKGKKKKPEVKPVESNKETPPIVIPTVEPPKEEKDFLDILEVKVEYTTSSGKFPDTLNGIVHMDLGDATREVMDKIIDYNTGWITLWNTVGVKIVIKSDMVLKYETKKTGEIKKDKVAMVWL